MIWAGRTDLRIAVVAAIIPFVTGLVVGLVSGYAGGRIDWVIGRIVDTFVAFPFYVLIIAIVFAVGTGENGIFIAYALVGWISSARVIRAKTKALCREGWVALRTVAAFRIRGWSPGTCCRTCCRRPSCC